MSANDAFIESAGAASQNLDAGRGAGQGRKNHQIRFSVTGTAVGAHTYDQASYFDKIGDSVIAATTYVLATVTPSVSKFTAAEVAEYLSDRPMHLRNINIVGSNSADAVASLEVRPIRLTPEADEETTSIYANAFQNASDFQTTRVQIPIDVTIDGYTFIRCINDAEATAVSYKPTFTFGPLTDPRAMVPASGAALLRTTAK